MTHRTTAKYRIRNWSEYNKALVQRGSITIWFSPEASQKWLGGKEGKRERPKKYSDEALFMIRGLGDDDEARRIWKKLIGYHRRSLVETAMYRFKTLMGNSLTSRKMVNQRAEVFAKCQAINRMNALGMPKSRRTEI